MKELIHEARKKMEQEPMRRLREEAWTLALFILLFLLFGRVW